MNSGFKVTTTCRRKNPNTKHSKGSGSFLNGYSAHFKCFTLQSFNCY